MGKKLTAKINVLRAQAAAGNATALAALTSLTYVPPHLRAPDPLGARHRRSGYSGLRTRAYEGVTFKDGVHITAKTHQARRVSIAKSISPDYGLDRLQMLKDRRDRREARA